MLSLSMSVGRWNLSVELGRAAEPEEPSTSITLSDRTEVADDYEPDIEAGWGFAPVIVGETGPVLQAFPEGTVIRPSWDHP